MNDDDLRLHYCRAELKAGERN
uniref:Uncharacterized protein n=1 Tax=Lepeophtheirus salmonis TaxID=72036 RepID=A0A0K2VDH4_LEPSM